VVNSLACGQSSSNTQELIVKGGGGTGVEVGVLVLVGVMVLVAVSVGVGLANSWVVEQASMLSAMGTIPKRIRRIERSFIDLLQIL